MVLKKVHLHILLFVFASHLIYAQEPIIIKGNISDSNTGESISFVNIGIEGTLTGTASNVMGEFELSIPAEHVTKQLYFSAIGYENRSISVSDFLDLPNKNFELNPLSYDIEDIEISTASRVLYRKVLDASLAVAQNFIDVPFQSYAIYSTENYQNDVLQNKRDAIISISDATGYGNKQNAFEARNYQLVNVIRNFEIETLSDGNLLLDELLSFDIARTTGNILDTLYLSGYDLELLDDNAETLTIAYQHLQPGLANTGDFYAKTIKGKLTIAKNSNAILKAEAIVVADRQSILGRSFATKHENSINNIEYHYVVNYKAHNEQYVPDHIHLSKNYADKAGKQFKTSASLKFTSINTSQPILHSQRQYFEKLLSDPEFWESLKK